MVDTFRINLRENKKLSHYQERLHKEERQEISAEDLKLNREKGVTVLSFYPKPVRNQWAKHLSQEFI